MTLYSIVLYLHVLASLGLFVTLGCEGLSLFHLRRASTVAEVHLWIEPVPPVCRFLPSAITNCISPRPSEPNTVRSHGTE